MEFWSGYRWEPLEGASNDARFDAPAEINWESNSEAILKALGSSRREAEFRAVPKVERGSADESVMTTDYVEFRLKYRLETTP